MKHLRVARIGLVLLLLALGFAGLSRPASAAGAAPAGLQVGTSFQPYGGTVVLLPSAPFTVSVVNGGGVPVQGCPYYDGWHLDLNKSIGNACSSDGRYPETNSFSSSTDGGPDSFYYQPYSKKFFRELMWCGQAGGITEGNFKIQVTVNPGANKNQITYNGAAKTGKWNVLAVELGGSNSQVIAYDTNTVQAVAYNPYTTLVYFNFVEDPPPTPFFGKMTTTKKLGTTTPSTGDVGGANVRITNSINGWYYDATSNPFTLGNLNVCESNPRSFNCGAAKYKNTVTVPSGYKVTSVNVEYPTAPPAAFYNIPAWPAASSSFSCTGPGNTISCSASNLWVLFGSNQTQLETKVVWNFESLAITGTYKYPWLQTTQGNVVANGKISGNIASDTLVGNRATTSTTKEAEFLIISKIGGGGPFCSRKNYILTNNSATNINDPCGNGSGYSVLNVASVATGTAEDKVVKGVKDAYNALPAACQTNTSTVSSIPTSVDSASTACPNGIIVKYTGTSLTGYTLTKGRVTILVDTNLTIDGSVSYGGAAYTNPRDVPNLAIVVKGNIGVSKSIDKVDASLYATGTISTCEVATTYICPKDVGSIYVNQRLVVNGFMSAQQGFRFGRVYTNDSLRSAAEIINLTLQSVVYPPPGIDYGSVFKGDSSVKIDSSEYPPRF